MGVAQYFALGFLDEAETRKKLSYKYNIIYHNWFLSQSAGD